MKCNVPFSWSFFFSARLAAAAGSVDQAGLKEDGKRDVISGRRLLHKPLSLKVVDALFYIFLFLTCHFYQIVPIQRETQNPKNTEDTLPRRRKRRRRKMKSRKRNPHLAPHLKAALLQAQNLKVKGGKRPVMENTL